MIMNPESSAEYIRKPIIFGDSGEFEMLDGVEHVDETNGRHITELVLFFKNRSSGEEFGVDFVPDPSLPEEAMSLYEDLVCVSDISPTTVLKFMHQPSEEILRLSKRVND